MINYKRQALEQAIIGQQGQQRLCLNDIIINYEGAQILAALLPQYHVGLHHIQIKGNNIDSQGFQTIFTALLHCTHLKSISAEWNNIGSSDVGLETLAHLVHKLHYLEYIDLKNNRISHHLSGYIAQIIQANRQNLKVIDLRWNDLGELGAKNIKEILSLNKNLKFLGLQDNRISTGTLMEIQSQLKANTFNQGNIMRHSQSYPGKLPQYFPLSGDEFQSMDAQLKTGQIRSKIDNQQKQATLYTEKLQVQIQKLLQKMKLRGVQHQQMTTKYNSLLLQNRNLIDDLRQAERILSLSKEKVFGLERSLNEQKSRARVQKYKLNHSIQEVMEKYTQRNQRQLEQVELVMGQKLDRLNMYLKQKLHEKRKNRQKIAEIKQDIAKAKLNKEQAWNKGVNIIGNSSKNTWEEECFALEQLINRTQSTVNSEQKKGNNFSKQLKNLILKALKKQEKLEQQIFGHQNKIKQLHNDMTLKNLENQLNLSSYRILQSKEIDNQSAIEMQRRYIKYILSQNNIQIQIQHMKQEQLGKASQVSDENIQIRIADLERALRAQQAQNKMVKNQYQKLMSLLQNASKKTIQGVLFD